MRLLQIALASLLLATACGTEEDEVESGEYPAISFNAISFNAISFNALSANAKANELMTKLPLATESYDFATGAPELYFQLHDPLTREFMSYLVSCALAPGQVVQWWDKLDGWAYYKWEGSLGLCPSWATGPASQECQEIVSACLLARNNAFGKSVRLSFRGEDIPETSDAFMLATKVPTGAVYESNTAIASFNACAGTAFGPLRECSWRTEHVGQCMPGSAVQIGAGAAPPGACGTSALGASVGDTMLRVCGGIRGCKTTDAAFIAQNDDACGTLYPAVNFTCPASGYFSVMSAAYNSSSTATTTSVVVKYNFWTKPKYPQTEAKVFPWREAAFYGNMFDPAYLKADIYVDDDGFVHGREGLKVEGSIYSNMWACWSNNWNWATAYMNLRVCGGPFAVNCAATPVGACQDYYDASFAKFQCVLDDGPVVPGDRDYQDCRGGSGAEFKFPITTTLNSPCDIVSEAEKCYTVGKGPL